MKTPPTYKDAGVDIAAGEQSVDRIREKVRRTFVPGVMSGLGGFSGLFSLKDYPMKEPVLVSGTDGVGTKLKVAFMMDKHDTVGMDAVAMCVNDVITCGAKPLFFLDYIATGKLEPSVIELVVDGIIEGCVQAGCALIGGEMAEMPGFYAAGEYDIAGFCVGIVEREKIIDGSKMAEGDIVLGIPSSGLHSNGYSLVRRVVFELNGFTLDERMPGGEGTTIGENLLKPTRIYARAVEGLVGGFNVKGMANVTGGGLESNVSRIFPAGLRLRIDWGAWPEPKVFDFIRKSGGVEEEEMRRVFNLGIGMAVVVSPAEAEAVRGFLEDGGWGCFEIGRVEKV